MLAKTLVVLYVWSPDIFVLFFYQNIFQVLRILLCQIKHYHTIPYCNIDQHVNEDDLNVELAKLNYQNGLEKINWH